MNSIDLMEYWFKSADVDYDTMLYMKAGKKNLGACLCDIWWSKNLHI